LENPFAHIEDFLTDESFRSWVTHPTPELDRHWQAWLGDHPEKQVEVEQARALILGLRFTEYQADPGARARMLDHIKQETTDSKRRVLWGASVWLKAAAVLLLLLSAGAIWRYVQDTDPPTFAQSEAVPMVYISHAAGERARHSLPDGSTVFLNAGSSLTYPEVFPAEAREVTLAGEAFFEVVSDARRPFRVSTPSVEVVVLGTQFNVNTHLSQPAVALVEGKVRLKDLSSGSSLALSPGQMATLDGAGGAFAVTPFDRRSVTGWKDGYLTFRDASLPEVMDKLHAWYGLHIRLVRPPAASDWSYTATFRHESLENVLLNMRTLRPFAYDIQGDSLRLTFE
jgi:transmembrane sensor